MSFIPDLRPLVEQVKEFNQHQQTIIALLQTQNQLLIHIKEQLQKND